MAWFQFVTYHDNLPTTIGAEGATSREAENKLRELGIRVAPMHLPENLAFKMVEVCNNRDCNSDDYDPADDYAARDIEKDY